MGELRKVSGWLRKLLALTATKEWELSEMTAPVVVYSYIQCTAGCTDSLVFKKKKQKKKARGNDLFVLLLTNNMWETFGEVNN